MSERPGKNPLVSVDPIDEGPGSFAFWQDQAKRACDWWQALADSRGWDQNLQSYLVKPLASMPATDTVVVPRDYALAEQKKALLFFQIPEVVLTPQQPGLEDATQVFQAVVNRLLQPDQVNAQTLMDEVLMDLLVPAGVGVSKIGYEATVDGEVPILDPQTGQPAMDPMTGAPILGPNIVRERYFWDRVPIKDVLIPPEFHGADWDRAPWLGMRFKLDRTVAQRLYKLADPAVAPADDETARLQGDLPTVDAKPSPQVTGYEVWYRAARIREDVANDDILYQLIWFEGESAPSVHRPSPYQKVEQGKVIGGMLGFPLHALTLRYVSDQAVPPSDCSITRGLGDELTDGRSAMIRQRKRNGPKIGYDPGRTDTTMMDRLTGGDVFVPVAGGSAADSPVWEIARPTMARENFEFDRIIERDYNLAWAIDSNQQGQQTSGKRTATELSLINQATQTRMEKERVMVARWFVAGVQKLAALVQMFADAQDYIELVGEDGARRLEAWDKTRIQGRFLFTAKPDSTQRLDAQFDRKQAVDEYSFLRKDPLVNEQYLLTRMARRLNMDPRQLIKQPQPPAPEKPNVSLALKSEDLSPLSPAYANVYALLQQAGMAQGLVPPPPQGLAGAAAPPPGQPGQPGAGGPPAAHGGMASTTRPLSQQQADQTGMLPGGGQTTAVQ